MPITTQERTFSGHNGLIVNYNADVTKSDIGLAASIISEFVHTTEGRACVILNLTNMGVYSDALIASIVDRSMNSIERGDIAPKVLMVTGEGELQELIEAQRREDPELITMPLIPRLNHGITCMEMMVTVSKYRTKRTLAATS